MVRRRSCVVSNHKATLLILRDAAKTPLLRMREKSLDRDAMTPVSAETNSTLDATKAPVYARADAPLEKIALEIYVPPAKPSLVGLSRAEVAERLPPPRGGPGPRPTRGARIWDRDFLLG